MEEHIAYLLSESTKLREKNEKLEKTVADHAVLAESIRLQNEGLNDIKMASDVVVSMC